MKQINLTIIYYDQPSLIFHVESVIMLNMSNQICHQKLKREYIMSTKKKVEVNRTHYMLGCQPSKFSTSVKEVLITSPIHQVEHRLSLLSMKFTFGFFNIVINQTNSLLFLTVCLDNSGPPYGGQ